MTFPSCCRIAQARAISLTSSTARLPKARQPGGWLAGMGSLAMPGVGPLVAAGPIMAALSSAAAGGAIGGMAGALVGFGFPEYEAKQYEGKVKNGNILISVHTEDSKERHAAKEIFDEANAEDISYSGEARV